MGLGKILENKLGGKSSNNEDKSYKERYEEAEKLKQKQAEYDAEKAGYNAEKVRQAKAKGRQRAKGSGGSIGSVFEGIGRFGEGMARVGGTGMTGDPFGFAMGRPRIVKKKPTTRKQVVVVKVVGAGGSVKKTTHKKRSQSKKHPFELF